MKFAYETASKFTVLSVFNLNLSQLNNNEYEVSGNRILADFVVCVPDQWLLLEL